MKQMFLFLGLPINIDFEHVLQICLIKISMTMFDENRSIALALLVYFVLLIQMQITSLIFVFLKEHFHR